MYVRIGTQAAYAIHSECTNHLRNKRPRFKYIGVILYAWIPATRSKHIEEYTINAYDDQLLFNSDLPWCSGTITLLYVNKCIY